MSTVTLYLVPVEDMQRALRDSGLSVREASRRVGYVRNYKDRVTPGGDTSRLKRKLGMMEHVSGTHGHRSRQRYVDYDWAVEAVRAWGLDPVDYDL